MDAGGAIYGSSPFAGAAGQGQIFRITLSPKVSYSVLHEFTGTGGAADAGGGQPYSGVVVGPGGVLYGATFAGGSVASPTGYASGVVYSLTPPASAGAAWGYQVLHSFDYYNGGFGPWGGVTLDPSGVLYGTTNGSNQYSPGVMYKISPPAAGATGWTETDVYQLPGYGQHYRMFQDGAGVLYGSSDGEIFKFKP
jgi:hypothetical protein